MNLESGFWGFLLVLVQVAQLTEMAGLARKTLSFIKLKAARRTDVSSEPPLQLVEGCFLAGRFSDLSK